MAPIGAEHFTAEDGRLMTGEASQHPAYHILISARDMARFGLLMLRGGKWGERQVVSADWVAESTRDYSDASLYGAQLCHVPRDNIHGKSAPGLRYERRRGV